MIHQIPICRGYFMQMDRAFKDAYLSESIENVDIYNLICKIFDIEPSKNDGDLNRIENILK